MVIWKRLPLPGAGSLSDPGWTYDYSTAPGARETDYDPGMHIIDIIRVSITIPIFVCSISLVSTDDLIFWGYGLWYTRLAEVRKVRFQDLRVLVGGRERSLYAEETCGF